MARATDEQNRNYPVIGQFIEHDYKKTFDYTNILDAHGPGLSFYLKRHGCTHVIFLTNKETRGAIVKKTVAYVLVAEDENCNPIWEKWTIKMQWHK